MLYLFKKNTDKQNLNLIGNKNHSYKMSSVSLLGAVVISLGLISCNSRFGKVSTVDKVKSTKPNLQSGTKDPEELITYDTLKISFFDEYCTSCHSSESGYMAMGIDLDDYESVKSNITAIYKTTIIDKTMPKYRQVSEGELALLKKWIDEGAVQSVAMPSATNYPMPTSTPAPSVSPSPLPEFETTPNPSPTPTLVPIPTATLSPTPTPSSTPTLTPVPEKKLIPTFASIEKNIFSISCNFCHSERTASYAGGVVLTKDALLNSSKNLVKPGFPNESGLIIAIERTDQNRMPPPGMNPVTPDQIDVIKEWILNGAKD